MARVIIPKKLAEQGDLVLVPRKEYEEFLKFKKPREFQPTKAQRKALEKARKERLEKYITLTELQNEMARFHTS